MSPLTQSFNERNQLGVVEGSPVYGYVVSLLRTFVVLITGEVPHGHQSVCFA